MALALRFAEEGEYSSRACPLSYDEDIDGDVNANPPPSPPEAIFRWSMALREQLEVATSPVVAVRRLIVATSGSPAHFLSRLTSAWTRVGTLVITDHDPLPVTLDGRRPAASAIFAPSSSSPLPSELAVIVPGEITGPALWCWIAALDSHVAADETLVLDAQLSAIYDFGFGGDDRPMLRMLATTKAADAQLARVVPILETPRFVSGLAAALLTNGELRQRRVWAFVSLRSPNTAPTESAQSFTPLIGLLDLPTPSPMAENKDGNDPSSLVALEEPEFSALYT